MGELFELIDDLETRIKRVERQAIEAEAAGRLHRADKLAAARTELVRALNEAEAELHEVVAYW